MATYHVGPEKTCLCVAQWNLIILPFAAHHVAVFRFATTMFHVGRTDTVTVDPKKKNEFEPNI